MSRISLFHHPLPLQLAPCSHDTPREKPIRLRTIAPLSFSSAHYHDQGDAEIYVTLFVCFIIAV